MTLYQGNAKQFVGQFRHRILVQQMTETNDTTTGQPTRTWSTFANNLPAVYHDITGGEGQRAGQIEAQSSTRFTVRYMDGFKPTMRIYFNGTYHNITDVRQVDGNRRYLDLYCRNVNNGEVIS